MNILLALYNLQVWRIEQLISLNDNKTENQPLMFVFVDL